MNTGETRKTIARINSIADDLNKLYRELHRQEEYTEAEVKAMEDLHLIESILIQVRGELIRQYNHKAGVTR